MMVVVGWPTPAFEYMLLFYLIMCNKELLNRVALHEVELFRSYLTYLHWICYARSSNLTLDDTSSYVAPRPQRSDKRAMHSSSIGVYFFSC
jgi:hypothetical protein